MNRVPRASLSITILDDEDYRVLMSSPGGIEAFGVFVAMIIVGRERLQQGKARQIPGTDSLAFDNSTAHLLAMTHVGEKAFTRCLKILAAVSAQTGSAPWMHLDDSSRPVIRSFFKFNTCDGWGGSRPGAGRPRHRNQDSGNGNQLDFNLESSGGASGAGAVSDSVSDSFPPSGRAPRESPPARPLGGQQAPSKMTHRDCVELARSFWGDAQASAIEANPDDLGRAVGGRWDCLADALRHLHGEGREIENIRALAISVTWRIERDGPDAPRVSVKPRKPAAPSPEEQARRDAELMERIDVSKLY